MHLKHPLTFPNEYLSEDGSLIGTLFLDYNSSISVCNKIYLLWWVPVSSTGKIFYG